MLKFFIVLCFRRRKVTPEYKIVPTPCNPDLVTNDAITFFGPRCEIDNPVTKDLTITLNQTLLDIDVSHLVRFLIAIVIVSMDFSSVFCVSSCRPSMR